MISLILPKLIRSSVARDGMVFFAALPATSGPDWFSTPNDTRRARGVQPQSRRITASRTRSGLRSLTASYLKLYRAKAKVGRRQPATPQTHADYLTSTFAPASSSFFLAASVSALFAPSNTGLGAPSTSAFASARPRPAFTSRTALMVAIFLSAGTDTRITSNVSLAAAAGAAAAPPAAAPAAATATGAAAVTPRFSSNFFTRSAASMTVNLLNSSTRFAVSAIYLLLSFCSSRRPPRPRRVSVHGPQTDDL